MDLFMTLRIISELNGKFSFLFCLNFHKLNFFMEFIIRRSDCPATNVLLMNNIGKDLSAEMNNPQHRSALDYISSHLRIGKFSFNDNEEKVSVFGLKF